jgi:hypothetical protein
MTDLSPAAQAIVAAFDDRYELLGPLEDNWQEVCIAAALHAAAHHLTHDRRQLRSLATELDPTC